MPSINEKLESLKTSPIYGRYADGDANKDAIQIDAATNAVEIIEFEHAEIHGECSFTGHYDNTTGVVDDARSAIGFKTPNTKRWVHAIFAISASDPAEFSIEEAVTIDDAAGTEKTIYNRQRNSVKTSGVKALNAAGTANQYTTYTEAQIAGANYTAGTVLEHVTLAGGEGPWEVGGASRGSHEWVLRQNTKYLLKMQNIGANANIHEIHIDWYEHTDKHRPDYA